jgi:hypothetical protein
MIRNLSASEDGAMKARTVTAPKCGERRSRVARREAAIFTINHAVNDLKSFLEKRGD